MALGGLDGDGDLDGDGTMGLPPSGLPIVGAGVPIFADLDYPFT